MSRYRLNNLPGYTPEQVHAALEKTREAADEKARIMLDATLEGRSWGALWEGEYRHLRLVEWALMEMWDAVNAETTL